MGEMGYGDHRNARLHDKGGDLYMYRYHEGDHFPFSVVVGD